MSASNHLKNFNYLVKEREGVSSRQLIAQISSFFAQQFSKNIIILTKSQLSTDEATQLFRSLTSEQRTCIIFHYCNNFQSVLDKLLTLDSSATVPPKLIIIESLHQFYDHTTAVEKLPSIYATIFATAQDLVNVNSRLLNETCFSFITSDPDELPTSVIDLLYDFPIIAGDGSLEKVLQQHLNPEVDILSQFNTYLDK